ncbi:MAG: undecaprenyldiphospho-muramoylpentapeptide beta-N-acetylglucosaminyltransferase [Halothiobacillaceae bacterium]
MAGGTGGHVIPALAVAGALAEEGFDVLWLGTRAGLEARLVPEAGFEIVWLDIGGLRGKSLGTRLRAPLRLVRAVGQAWKVIRRRAPVLAVGMGGYASGPGGVAALLAGVPLVIHEQNAVAGLTNRLLSRLAARVLSAYPQVFHVPNEVVGNPVRESITSLPPPEERFADRSGPLRVLIIGGSLGAAALNRLVPEALALWSREVPLHIVHQCGPRHVETAEAAYQAYPPAEGSTCEVVAYLDDMSAAYAQADLVIARAGALTVAEIAAAGLPSVLVPFPHAVDDHQAANAGLLVEAEAALMIRQDALEPSSLAGTLRERFSDREALLRMAVRARGQASPQALEVMVAHCLAVIDEREVAA